MNTSFRLVALPAEPFALLSALSAEALAEKNVRRMVADASPGYPCRVSLEDAAAGERVLLLPFTHQSAASPYHASGPIFVREGAAQASPAAGEVPLLIRHRLLSVRSYDAADLMVDAETCEGSGVEGCIARMLTDPAVSYLHLHYAKPGCFACRVERA